MSRTALAIVVVLSSGLSLGERRASPLADPVAVVRAYVDDQNERDLNGMLRLVADTIEVREGLPNGPKVVAGGKQSREQFRAQIQKAFQSAPNARFEIVEVLAEGSIVVTKERATGLPSENGIGVAVYRVRQGRIDLLWLILTP